MHRFGPEGLNIGSFCVVWKQVSTCRAPNVSTLFPGGRGLAVVARRVERAAAHRDLHRGAPGPGTGRCRAWCGHRSRGANAGLAWALGGEACRRTLGARRPRRRSTLAHRACAMARGCLRKGALGSSKKAVPGPPRTIPILVNPGIGRAGCPRRSTSDWPRSVDSVHPFPPSFSPTTTTRWVSRREEWCAALQRHPWKGRGGAGHRVGNQWLPALALAIVFTYRPPRPPPPPSVCGAIPRPESLARLRSLRA